MKGQLMQLWNLLKGGARKSIRKEGKFRRLPEENQKEKQNISTRMSNS